MGIKFTVFSDFHYDRGSLPATCDHMETIMDSAYKNGAEFILQCGDFAKNWPDSPEIVDACLNNSYHLPVYGAYGNHDMENVDNRFSFVTPRMTNDAQAVWGTADGQVGDGEITYYYVDRGAYRIISLDTNHSYFPREDQVKHAPPGMGEAPLENVPRHILGERQLQWLEGILMDAARRGLSCIIISHAGFAGFKKDGWEYPTPSYDVNRVRALFHKVNEISPRTVVMAIFGHYHTDHAAMDDNIVFFSVNSVITGWWDCDHHCPWRYGVPIFAHVTITDNYQIIIEGMEGCWQDHKAPPEAEKLIARGVHPNILSRTFQLK